MRLTALSRISQMTEEEILERLESLPEYNELPDGGKAVREYWQEFLNRPQAEVVIADDLTEDEKKQFIIKDNVSFGDWDYDELENWDSAKLEDWGVDMMLPDFGGEGSKNWGEGSHQKNPINSELDVDGFGDKIKMVLELSIEEHAFIQQRLSQDGMTKEQVLLNLLGYAEQ